MRLAFRLFSVVALFVLAEAREARAGHSWPAPESTALWAVVDLPSGRHLGPAMAMLDRIYPGAAAEIRDWIPRFLADHLGARTLDGVHLDRPIRLAIVDPNLYEAPMVALVQVRDARALRRGVERQKLALHRGQALLGAADAREVAGAYLLGAAAAVPIASELRMVAFGPPLAARQQSAWAGIQQDLAAMATRNAPAMALVRTVLNGLQTATRDIQYIEIRLTGQQAGAHLVIGADIRITLFTNTLMERFAGTQQPSSFDLLGKLPALPGPFLLGAGRLEPGPLRPQILALSEVIAAAVWGEEAVPQVRPHVQDMLSCFTGEMATAVMLSIMPLAAQSYSLSAVDDTNRARHVLFALQQATAGLHPRTPLLGIAPKTRFRTDVFTHHDVGVAEELGSMGAPMPDVLGPLAGFVGQASTTYYAAFDQLWASVMGSRGHMRALIDAARGTAAGLAPPPRMQHVIDVARGREDSIFLAVEPQRLAFLAALLGVSMPAREFTVALTLGFAGGTPSLFLGVVL